MDGLEELTTPELMRRLAMARSELEYSGRVMRYMIDNVKANPLYVDMSVIKEQAAMEELLLADEIRARAVAAYDGQNKKPWSGVAIQEKSVVTLEDPAAALVYAVERAPALVRLDMPGLESLAKKLAGTPAELPFCVVTKVPTATIAKDLSEYVKVEETDEEVPF